MSADVLRIDITSLVLISMFSYFKPQILYIRGLRYQSPGRSNPSPLQSKSYQIKDHCWVSSQTSLQSQNCNANLLNLYGNIPYLHRTYSLLCYFCNYNILSPDHVSQGQGHQRYTLARGWGDGWFVNIPRHTFSKVFFQTLPNL